MVLSSGAIEGSTSSHGGDIEPIAKRIELPPRQADGAELEQRGPIEDRVGDALVHLPRNVAHTVPARARVVNRSGPLLRDGVVIRCADVVVEPESLQRLARQVGQHQRLAAVRAGNERPIARSAR